jgi:hypothetical protein
MYFFCMLFFSRLYSYAENIRAYKMDFNDLTRKQQCITVIESINKIEW